MNLPLVSVVVLYAAGLLLGQWLHPPLTALFIACFGLLAIVFVTQRLRPFAFWLLLPVVGWTNLLFHQAVLSPADLRTQLGTNAALVSVRGELLETPRLKIIRRNDQEKWRHVARVRVTELRRGDTLQPATGEILVVTPGLPGDDFFAGQPVEIFGVIAPPARPLAEGLFDFRDYLATRGIYYELKTEATNDWQLLNPHRTTPPLTDRFLRWSQRTLALGLPSEDETLRLLWAMTLGWHTAFSETDISEPFLRAGTMHMFAIDGLRIALLAGIIVTLLRALRVARAWSGVIAIPTLWFYTAATGWEASAIRASVMMTVVLGGWALKRPSNIVNSLAAAAFVLLLAEPRQLFEASFQLSFFVMLVIALGLPPMNESLDRWLRLDPLLLPEQVAGWKMLGLRAARRIGQYGALSLAAWLGSIPLAAKYFHLFSPVSTLANLFAVPLGTLALMANLGALLCGHWLPWATALFNHAAWFYMAAMTWVSVVATRLPGAYYYVPEISWFTIAAYYAVLLAVLGGWFRRHWRLGGWGLLLLALFYVWQWERSRNEISLTALPLQGGHAVWVDAPGSERDWLMDCGNDEAVRFPLTDFLHGQGVNVLPRLLLTAGDQKNTGGVLTLAAAIPVRELITSSVEFRSPAYRAALAAFDQPLSNGRTRHEMLWAGETSGDWKVLFPQITNGFARAEDAPLVLRGNFYGTKILLLPDLSRMGQSHLLAAQSELAADILVAGLPVTDEALSDGLLAAIHPQLVVIVDSENPAARRASRTLQARLAQSKIPVLYTRNTGALTIVISPSGWKVRTVDGLAGSSQLGDHKFTTAGSP